MRRTTFIKTVAATAVGFAIAACGGSDDGASGCTPGPEVTVHALDALDFDADSYDTAAGCVEFTYVNDGTVGHTLLLRGVDGFKLAVGDTDVGAVDIEPGSYTLFCDIAGHEAAGMSADLTVG